MKLTHLLLALGAVFLLALVFPAPYGNSKTAAKGSACLSNVKRQTIALMQYTDDHDERYPLRDEWMDRIVPYAKDDFILHCPALPPGTFGYAFNARLSAAQAPPRPETVPLVYDSVNPIRNASDRMASRPAKGRHSGRNSVAYVDGHARREAP